MNQIVELKTQDPHQQQFTFERPHKYSQVASDAPFQNQKADLETSAQSENINTPSPEQFEELENVAMDGKSSQSFLRGKRLLQTLRILSKNPTLRLNQTDAEQLKSAVQQHKKHSHQIADPHHILGKRLKGLPSETETKKRQRLMEIKDQEGGKKCLSPSIFRKSKGPILFAVQSANFQTQGGVSTTAANSGSANNDTSNKTSNFPSKRIDSAAIIKELTLQDFDINLCTEAKDVHLQSFKCFDNYLGLVSQLYYGLPVPQTLGKGRQDPLAGFLAQQNKRAAQKIQQGNNFAQQTIGDTSLQLQQQNQQSSCNQIIENINGQGCSSTIEQDKQQSSNNFYRPSVPTKDENRFKFTTFEELINPLRSDHPFELWAPKEVALFEACICRYGKNFDKFIPFIKSKSEKEVIDFYFAWKKTEHYKTWKNKQDKRKVSDNQNDWVFF
eukprot:403338323